MVVNQVNKDISSMESDEMFEIEPNRVAEYYRNYQPQPSLAKIEKNLDFIECFEDGSTLLGSSDLSGRRWGGSLFFFSSPEHLPEQSKSVCGLSITSGVTDGKFLSNENQCPQFVVGEDSGTLSVLGLTKTLGDKAGRHIVLQSAATEHDDAISSLSVFPDKNRVVSGSLDCCIKVWDSSSMVSEATYRPAHSRSVTSVSAHSGGHLFASGSLDHLALMWDHRQEKPAQLVLDCKVAVTSVVWQPGESFLLAVGTSSGDVSLVDTRNNKEVVGNCAPFQRSVFRLCFCPSSPNLLAGCADGNFVVVLDCKNPSQLSPIYEDSRHTDFVRGLAWSPAREVLSCGWDSSVLRHQPLSSSSANQETASKANTSS